MHLSFTFQTSPNFLLDCPLRKSLGYLHFLLFENFRSYLFVCSIYLQFLTHLLFMAAKLATHFTIHQILYPLFLFLVLNKWLNKYIFIQAYIRIIATKTILLWPSFMIKLDKFRTVVCVMMSCCRLLIFFFDFALQILCFFQIFMQFLAIKHLYSAGPLCFHWSFELVCTVAAMESFS